MKATTSIHYDTRRAKDGNRYPLKLRITHLRKRKYYSLGIDFTPKEWEKMNAPKPRGSLKEAKDKAYDEVERANSIIDSLDGFSFLAFEARYLKVKPQTLDLKAAFKAYCEALNEEKRIGTAESYNSALTSLMAFRKGLMITDVTPEFLHRYEGWMQKNGRALTTVGIYLRSLRTILNTAIENGIIKPEQYPFGKRKYQIPRGQNIKKALTLDDISRLYYYPAEGGSAKDKARDFWMFSYLANGMNFKDICRLKFGNIHNDTLVFYRAKTERSKRSNPVPIVVIVTDELRRLIGKWSNREWMSEEYVFPVLTRDMTARLERKTIQQFIKTTNKWLGRIAREVGILSKVTTYAARHSFSTVMRNGGAPIDYIKESLGHNSTITTENYLHTYPDSMKRRFTDQLMVFKKYRR